MAEDKTKKNCYDIVVLIVSFIIAGAAWCYFEFRFEDMALTICATFLIFALILIHIARGKEDENRDIRVNSSLMKFYLKSAFLLISVSAFLAIVAVFHTYWPNI